MKSILITLFENKTILFNLKMISAITHTYKIQIIGLVGNKKLHNTNSHNIKNEQNSTQQTLTAHPLLK